MSYNSACTDNFLSPPQFDCHANKELILSVYRMHNRFPLFSVVEGVAQLLEGLSGRLLASLKEVLVERNRLTVGKELGKGKFMIPH